MKWLIWKDYRVNRLVFITALVLLVAPHALFAILIWCGFGPKDHLQGAYAASYVSLVLLQLAFALLGGNSIAGERIDRSAEFLAYLPVSRGRILTSKLLVVLAAIPLVWLPNLVVMAIAGASARPPVEVLFRELRTIAITGVTFFCVAWLFSCILESPTFSVSAGLIVPFLVAMTIWGVSDLRHVRVAGEVLLGWYWGLCLAISAASFPTGTLYYLRRVGP
jgi:ABC-type transport system involved in multi-copper enzyme maturation permease subunit